MLQSTPTRGTATTWVGAVFQDAQRRRLVIAVVLLLAAITAVLVRNYESSLSIDLSRENDETVAVSQPPAPAPSAVEPAPTVSAAAAQLPLAGKHSTKGTAARTLSSHPHGAARPATWGPATKAAEQARTSDQAQAHKQTPSYPLLTQATAVQGSVLLQALIAADGAVEELRVISGPTILVSAARQAVQQWRFKPYLINGKPVETYARVTVNFSIDVSNTEARYHINSVTSTGAL